MIRLMPKKTNSIMWLPKKESPLNADTVNINGNAAQWTAHSMDARNPRKSLLIDKKRLDLIVSAIELQFCCDYKYMQQRCKKQEIKLIFAKVLPLSSVYPLYLLKILFALLPFVGG